LQYSVIPDAPAMLTVSLPAGAKARARLPTVQVEVCAGLDAIAALATDWQDLLWRCPYASLFMSPNWHLAWWRTFGAGRAAHVIALRHHGRLIGVIPLVFYRDRIRGLPVRVLGTYNNEHASRSGMIIEPGSEIAAAQALAANLQHVSGQWDVVMMRQLPPAADWLPPFIEACRTAGLSVFGPTPGIGKCVLPLHGNWNDYLAQQTGHFRCRVRANLRRVEKRGNVVYRRSSGTPEDFDIFQRLEQSSWKQGDGYARLGPEGWGFHRELALTPDSGISCCNVFLEIDGQVLGGVHALGYRNVTYSMQTLFDESIRELYPGRAQFTVHISDMFADERFDTLDLNGNSDFCKSWSATEQPFVTVQMFNLKPYSRLLRLLRNVAKRGLSASGRAQ
jgi:CelD/BcsL family acetyltransferase involved in cellulose biosynthesis